MADEMRLPIFKGDGSKDPFSIGSYANLCGSLSKSSTKLLRELSLVIP
jgi:hypothetical protein